MAKNTIKLKNYSNIMEEYVATAVAITPGSLLELDNAGKVKAHATAAGNVLVPMVACEDELQGGSIDTVLAAGARVQVWIPTRGDQAYMLLKDGENVAIGDALESAGDGTLQKHVVDVDSAADVETLYTRPIVAVALEAVDLTGSANTTAKRIQVRIV